MTCQALIATGESKSAQHAELIAAYLAIKESVEQHEFKVYIYTDSWAVYNGITLWSGRWKEIEWTINGKDIWSKFLLERIRKIL